MADVRLRRADRAPPLALGAGAGYLWEQRQLEELESEQEALADDIL